MTETRPVRRVAVRGGNDDVAARLAESAVTVTDRGDAEAVVVVGEPALFEAALADDGAPVVPVGVDDGHHAVTRQDVAAAGDALAAGDYRRVSHPVLGVDVDGDRVARAVMDVTLVTTEPARISEYAYRSEGERLDAVRADGVVVATPVGSSGYARAAGGPVLAPGAGLAVAPVAPFSTNADTWTVAGGVTLTVERDEGDVSLYADDERVRSVDSHVPVRISSTGSFASLRPLIDR